MSDIPFDNCVSLADNAIANGLIVYQKWTCDHCGARQTMDQPNVFYRSGTCEECNKVTDIEECGFMATVEINNE